MAECLLRDFARQGIVEKVEARRERILHELAASGAPVTAAELFARISSHYPADLRTFQRDLVDLGKQGRASRSDAGWSAATEILDELFEDRARAAALRLLGQAFEAAVPWEIQKSLREPLARARKKLEALPPGDPRNRWIEAFRLQPGHLELDDPVIDPEVIDAIQDAILQRTKVRISAQTDGVIAKGSFTAVGAVSHYLLEMPGRPSIEFWPDGSNRPARIRLEDIEAIESLAAANAYWPAGHEPTPIPAEVEFVLGDAEQHDALTKIVLRVSPDAALQLRKRKIGQGWAEERTDGEGWCIVSFRTLASMPLYRYLRSLRGVVILRPALFWKFAHMDYRQALRDYEQSLELVRVYQQEECGEQEMLPSSNSEGS